MLISPHILGQWFALKFWPRQGMLFLMVTPAMRFVPWDVGSGGSKGSSSIQGSSNVAVST